METATTNDIRERAAEKFSQLGWPTTRIEEWRYTNLAAVAKTSWRADDGTTVIPEPQPSFAARATLELVFVNGHLRGGVQPTAWPNGISSAAKDKPSIA